MDKARLFGQRIMCVCEIEPLAKKVFARIDNCAGYWLKETNYEDAKCCLI